MINWKLLEQFIHEKCWNFIDSNLKFSPFSGLEVVDRSKFKRIYDLSSYYNDGYNEDYVDNFHNKIISAFINSTIKGERVYALSWQHESYSFDPRLDFEKDEFNEWLIDVFANGDYNFFITSNFDNYFFADGVTMQVMYYGEAITESLENNKPLIFTHSVL